MAATPPLDVAGPNGRVITLARVWPADVAVGHPAHSLADARPCVRADGYARRRPEETALYQTVAEHWPGFRERVEDAGELPKFIVSDLEDYLKCGILEGAG